MTYAPKPENNEDETAAARRSTVRATLWVIALVVILSLCVGLVMLSGESPTDVEGDVVDQSLAGMPSTSVKTLPIVRMLYVDGSPLVEGTTSVYVTKTGITVYGG